MTRVLRHLSVRLWLVLLSGIPLTFWLLPRMGRFVSGISELPVMAAVLGGVWAVIWMGFEIVGRMRVRGLIKEGVLWEQAGIPLRAEKRFRRALRVYDSILVSPWSARVLSSELVRAIAGFYLSGKTAKPGDLEFKAAADFYLLQNPQDQTLAQLWLDRFKAANHRPRAGQPTSRDQSILTLLADTQNSHPPLARRLALIFLDLGREDLSARRLFQAVLNSMEKDPAAFAALSQDVRDRMAQVLEAGPEKKVFPADGPIQAHGPGLDAVSADHDGVATDPLSDFRGEARDREHTFQADRGTTLADQVFSPETFVREKAGALSSPKLDGPKTGKGIIKFWGRGITLVLETARAMGNLSGQLVAGVHKIRQWIRKTPAFGSWVKRFGLTCLGGAMAFFLWNSVAHMIQPKPQKASVYTVNMQVPKPYTIQVAAYVKQAHADRYMAHLAQKGVQARVARTEGGGKTWFLVRISSFQDKKSAAAYGNSLKEKGIIEEFFVSNI